MYGMTISGKLFADELTEWLTNVADFKQSHCQMSLYYKFGEDGAKIVVLSYVDDCIYWSTSEKMQRWFVEQLGQRFNVNFLGYVHWFMSICITQNKDFSISVDQSRYMLAIVNKYLANATIEMNE